MKLIALVFNAAVFSCLLHPEGVVSRVLDQEGLEALKKEVGNLEKIIPIVQEEQKLEELIGDFGDEESPKLEDDPLLEVFSRRINQDVDDNDDQYRYHDYNNYDYPEADNFYEYPEDDYELQDDAM